MKTTSTASSLTANNEKDLEPNKKTSYPPSKRTTSEISSSQNAKHMEKTTASTNVSMEKPKKEPEWRNKNENKDNEKADDRYTEEELNHHFDL